MFKALFLVVGFFSLLFCENPRLSSRKIVSGLEKPVYLTAPEGIIDTVFILEQAGKIRLITNEKLEKTPFLNITDRVHSPLFPGDERGLLGLAFHPEFGENGFFYLNYVSKDQYTIISKFCLITDDKSSINEVEKSEKILLKIKQPYSNHNGGQLEFGQDGHLYIGLGDGGSAGDPEENGQNNNSLLGSVLRIDVDSDDLYRIPPSNPFYNIKNVKGEVWLYGLRNPWRFSFDSETGEIYIGDVGQNSWEEIHVLSPLDGGANLGWNIMEGSHCFSPQQNCIEAGLTLPVFEYPNDANYLKTLAGFAQTKPAIQGCSITGGYVYRGKSISWFQGHYIFADYCTGKFWSFVYRDSKISHFTNRTEEIRKRTGKRQFYVSSFGKDGSGELYFLDYGGSAYKIVSD